MLCIFLSAEIEVVMAWGLSIAAFAREIVFDCLYIFHAFLQAKQWTFRFLAFFCGECVLQYFDGALFYAQTFSSR